MENNIDFMDGIDITERNSWSYQERAWDKKKDWTIN